MLSRPRCERRPSQFEGDFAFELLRRLIGDAAAEDFLLIRYEFHDSGPPARPISWAIASISETVIVSIEVLSLPLAVALSLEAFPSSYPPLPMNDPVAAFLRFL